MRKKILATLAGLGFGATLFLAAPAQADSGTMNFNEFGSVYLDETKAFVEVNDTGGDGHNCSCTGHIVSNWTQNGRTWYTIQYVTPTLSPTYSQVDFRVNDQTGQWLARRKWWGPTQYDMPPNPHG